MADIGLIWQVIYYQQVTLYTKLKQEESSNESIDMAAKKSAFWINIVGSSVLITVVVASCYAYNSDLFNNSNSTLSGLIGWASAVLYIGSRLPQIIKNWKAQSTEGLSSGMFICALFGNFSFTLVSFINIFAHTPALTHIHSQSFLNQQRNHISCRTYHGSLAA